MPSLTKLFIKLQFPKKLTANVIWLGSYLLLMIALWCLPNQFHTGWITFLHRPLNRFLLLLTTSAVIWLIYEQISLKRRSLQFEENPPGIPPNVKIELQALFTELRKTRVPKNQPHRSKIKSLNDLPWLLLLGTSESGKIDMYQHCGFKHFQMKTEQRLFGFNMIECYVSHHAVLFDINLPLIDSDDEFNSTSICELFLHTCQESRRSGLNSILVNLSMQQLTSIPNHQLTQLLARYKKTLELINQIVHKPIPTIISMNYMDSLSGFNSFFSHLDATERDLPWGLPLNQFEFSNINQLCERFDQQFDVLIQALHSQSIRKLHQEPHYQTRCGINEFPLQMDAIKRPLARILQYIGDCFIDRKNLQLKGVYFTASGHVIEQIDRLLPAINKTFPLNSIEKEPLSQPNAYFIRGLFYEVILPTACEQYISRTWAYRCPNIRYISSLTLASVLLLTCTFLWTRQLSNNLASISRIHDYLNEYEHQTQHEYVDLQDGLSQLNTLSAMVTALSEYQTPFLSIPIAKHQPLIDLAKAAYQQAIADFINRYLTTTLKNILVNQPTPDAAHLYMGLKFYIQFMKQESINPPDFHDWLVWNQGKDITLSGEDLKQHISSFLPENSQNITFDLSLIQAAREHLLRLPRHELAMILILEAHRSRRQIPLNAINHIIPTLTIKNNQGISGIYTKDAFKEIYETGIPQAAKIASEGNWVTGKIVGEASSDMPTFIQHIAEHYCEQYTRAWQDILNDLELVSFTSYQHAIQVMDNFTKPNSPLYELLQIAHDNTDIRYQGMSTPISIKFQNLHSLFNSSGERNYYAMLAQIRKLQEILAAIANATDPEKAAFIIAKQRMEHHQDDIFDEVEALAITLPIPLRQWVLTLNQSAWRLILTDARHFINRAWDEQVVDFYRSHLQPFYPFDDKAHQEVKLPVFNQFFSQQGILGTFYQNYLLPFTEEQDGSLYWKAQNGIPLSHESTFLTNLQHIQNIRDLFFSQSSTEASLEFSVQPLVLQPSVKASIFSIDEQQARFTHYAQLPQLFRWPHSQPLHMSSLAIINVDGQQVNISETGLWSLFRLLQHANKTPALEKNSLIATFDINGYGVEFEFLNNTNTNAFDPQLFSTINLDTIH